MPRERVLNHAMFLIRAPLPPLGPPPIFGRAINDIYNYYVAHSTCTYQLEPTTAEERGAWFQGHNQKYPVIVAENGGAGGVVAWGSLSLFHPRAAYRFTVENSVYVHPEHQRKGVGSLLLGDLICSGKAKGYQSPIVAPHFRRSGGQCRPSTPGLVSNRRRAG